MAINIAEKDLQDWFVDKARKQTIADFIINSDVLDTIQNFQQKPTKESERMRLLGLNNARKVYDRLSNAKYLSGNLSVSDKGHKQLRPDLVLISEDANYLLVELKTRKGTERQAVQELLAYSAAMKMQLPFINEFIFIIVALHWDTLLTFSVQSLIMDGKLVLPLILELDQNDDYQLRIHHSIFNIKPESPYDPFLAMVPHTIATTIYGNVNEPRSFRARNYTLNYFRYLSNLISSDCRKTKQSGFTLLARSQFNRQSICLGLTVVTVNQFWEYSEHHSSGIYPNRDISKRGMRRVHQNAAKQIHDEFYCKPIEKDDMYRELEDVFLSAEASQAEASLYAQSSLSFDLLQRYTSLEREKFIQQTGFIQSFELAGLNNLKELLSDMQLHRPTHIDILSTFGDVTDFLLEKSLGISLLDIEFCYFQKLMEDFQSSMLNSQQYVDQYR